MTEMPHLVFDFLDANGKRRNICFSNPYQIISVQSMEDVLPALQEIQKAVAAGFYAAGYLSYEAAPAFDASLAVRKGNKMPLLWFGLFKESSDSVPFMEDQPFPISDWKATTSLNNYRSAIHSIKEAIQRGDTYQVNYTMRLKAAFEGNDFAFYQQLREGQNSNYSAYLNTGRFRILSASPELFFQWNGQKVIARPMKGTVQRGRWWEEDQAYARWLEQSEKNRAENAMIVDLLRNDLGRIAETGSVKVEKLFEIERYPTVFQMTSTIEAITKPEIHLVDIFKALFPCGSITGAPKRSTMQIIAELEESPREVYCGAIGFLSPPCEAVFSVPIRTVVIDTQTEEAEYGVGGGITWDSTAEGEYEEVITKARVLKEKSPEFKLLESLRLENGSYTLLDRHLERLEKSAAYFQFALCLSTVRQLLNQFAQAHADGVYKVRLLVAKDGEVQITGDPIYPLDKPVTVALASTPVSRQNRFLYHKTTYREIYEQHRKAYPDVFDVLLWNEDRELTEFTIGNLVLEIEGKKWTPPRESGLLAGTLREELLAKGEIQERILTIEDLQLSSRIWLINSVRGWVPVVLNHCD